MDDDNYAPEMKNLAIKKRLKKNTRNIKKEIANL